MYGPELEPGCGVAGVVQAFMEGPVLIQCQAEAGSKVKEHMQCPLPTTCTELSVASPWVGMDPPRILNGQPGWWDPFVGAYLHIYVWGSLGAADPRAL